MSKSSFEAFTPTAPAASDASSALLSDAYPTRSAARSEVPSFASIARGDFTPPASVSPESWGQISQWVKSGADVKVSTPGDGQVPDYILGADGNLSKNPAKTTPSADGSITIQAGKEGDQASLQAAKELKIAVIQEKIFYWQQAHPNDKNIPGFLTNMLASAQSAPISPTQAADRPQPAPQRAETPAPSPAEVPSPSRASYSPSSSGGGERLGNSNIGSAPSSGYRPGSLESNGPIDRSAIPRPVEGDLNIKGPPSANPEQIQTFLEKMGSPAAKEAGFSQALYTACTDRGIDPAVAVGFFLQESTLGRYGRAHDNRSIGNIKGTAPESGGTDGTFRRYDTWAEGARDWARLIDDRYVKDRGLTTMSQVIGVYAPSSDGNNESRYVATVKGVVENFKQQNNAIA